MHCEIPANDPVYRLYHDEEWGRPVHDDTGIFEKVCLEGFQSGLSWGIILHRRDAFREAFAGFDLSTVAGFTDSDIERLMGNAGIIRNRRKIISCINNANRALELIDEAGSLDAHFRSYTPDPASRPLRITRQWLTDNTQTTESKALAASLKQRGWTFVGPTNLYALMQALGIVNDHVDGCEVGEKLREEQEPLQ